MASFNSEDQRPCRMCGIDGVVTAVDLGSAAVGSHYPDSPDQAIRRVPFRLGACSRCGLIQLQNSPEIDWLRLPIQHTEFREPDRHLDDICHVIANQIPSRTGLVLGLSQNDQPVLERLQRAGFTQTHVLDRILDWGLHSPRDATETMQQILTPKWAVDIRSRHGPVDLLCARSFLEHAHDLSSFLAGLRTLMAPQGWVFMETPGCETGFARGDVGMLWESHVSYFTPSSLRRGLSQHGFRCRWIGNYPYELEDSLTVFGQFDESFRPDLFPTNSGTGLLAEFDSARDLLRTRVQACSHHVAQRGEKLALWGAGHRTVTFVDLLPAHDLIDCVIDDDPAKQGLFLPGSGIPIVTGDALSSRNIGLTIGILNPNVMQNIKARYTDYTARGGRFLTLADLADCPQGDRS